MPTVPCHTEDECQMLAGVRGFFVQHKRVLIVVKGTHTVIHTATQHYFFFFTALYLNANTVVVN